ncbi:MAG: outer membrane beta-barrel protein [Bacteroidota bacterium]|nr:outer membrane beta-barrel protein [Bacteroidota bacterium]
MNRISVSLMQFRLVITFSFCIFLSNLAQAQLGKYLEVWGGPQYTQILNFEDISADQRVNDLNRLNTYKFAIGANYIHNYQPNFGYSFGINYNKIGQKYDGITAYDGNSFDTTSTSIFFKSEIEMTYLKIPLLFRFNSAIETGDRVGMVIFAGLQPGFLMSVDKVITSPAAPDSLLNRYPNYNFRGNFKKLDLSMMAGVQVNVVLNSKFNVGIGLKYERGFINIENRKTAWEKDLPVEYTFPVSTKKIGKSDITRQDSKINSVNAFLSIAYKVGTVIYEEPQDEELPDVGPPQ